MWDAAHELAGLWAGWFQDGATLTAIAAAHATTARRVEALLERHGHLPGLAPPKWCRSKTVKHLMTRANTYTHPDGRRECRTCRISQDTRRRRRDLLTRHTQAATEARACRDRFGELVALLRAELLTTSPGQRAGYYVGTATPVTFTDPQWQMYARRRVPLRTAAELTGLAPGTLRGYASTAQSAWRDGATTTRTMPLPAAGHGRRAAWTVGSLALWRAAAVTAAWDVTPLAQVREEEHERWVRRVKEIAASSAKHVNSKAVARELGIPVHVARRMLRAAGAPGWVLQPTVTKDAGKYATHWALAEAYKVSTTVVINAVDNLELTPRAYTPGGEPLFDPRRVWQPQAKRGPVDKPPPRKTGLTA